MEIDCLFAYGTLGPADEEAKVRDGWVADAVRGRLHDLGSYPILIDLDDPSAGWVEGHVRLVDSPERLSRLDAYEGEDFERRSTFSRSGRWVWVYNYTGPRPAQARGPIERWEGRRLSRWP